MLATVPQKATASPTLMAVLAHPDDESTSTGGILARYATEGVRTIAVTCTNGEYGDGPGGIKPGQPGHDTHQVAAIRLAELRLACQHLGVACLETLGYHDSGTATDSRQHDVTVFCDIPVDVAAAPVADLLNRYRPNVVVTHDPEFPFQHPDHVHAGRVTTQAVQHTHISATLYYKAHGISHWTRLRQLLHSIGVQLPEPTVEVAEALQVVERRITTVVDLGDAVDRKHAALHAHASQISSSLAGKLPLDHFRRCFSSESFIRARAPAAIGIIENSLLTDLDEG